MVLLADGSPSWVDEQQSPSDIWKRMSREHHHSRDSGNCKGAKRTDNVQSNWRVVRPPSCHVYPHQHCRVLGEPLRWNSAQVKRCMGFKPRQCMPFQLPMAAMSKAYMRLQKGIQRQAGKATLSCSWRMPHQGLRRKSIPQAQQLLDRCMLEQMQPAESLELKQA